MQPIPVNDETFAAALKICMIDGASAPLHTRRQAEEFLLQLSVSYEGLALALKIIDQEPVFNAVRLFWAFSTLIHHLPLAAVLPPAQCYHSAHQWLRRALVATDQPKVPEMVLNKHAQMMVVGMQEYWLQNHWPSVFSDLFLLVDEATGPPPASGAPQPPADVVLTYVLRFHAYVDERVVDQNVQKTKEQKDRDTAIKDKMRFDVIPRLVQTMYGTLCLYHHSHPDLAALCLDVVESYIDWADVSYFLNQEWMTLFYFLMNSPGLVSRVVECLNTLVEKGQPTAQLKLETLRAMRLVEAIPGIVEAVVQLELQRTQPTAALYRLEQGEGASEPNQYLSNVCNLVVSTATEASKVAATFPNEGLAILHAVVPFAVRLFDLPLYATKESVLPWLQLYVKTSLALPTEEEQIVASLLRQSLLPEDENLAFVEAVIEQRKQILNVTRVLNKKNPSLVTAHCWNVLQAVCGSGAAVTALPFQQVEAAVRYVYELGEGLPNMQSFLKDPNNDYARMITVLLQSSVIHHSSSVVHLAYFETLERFHPFFFHYKEAIPVLLTHILQSPNGICNRASWVRSKNCQIFTRLVGYLKAQLMEHSPQIISALFSILGHNETSPGVAAPPSGNLLPADRCDIYEGLGMLLASTDLTACAVVVQHIIGHLQQCKSMAYQTSASSQTLVKELAPAVADDIGYLSALVKGLGALEATRLPDSPPFAPKDVPFLPTGDGSNGGGGLFPARFELPSAVPEPANTSETLPQTVRVFFAVTESIMQVLETWGGLPMVRDKGIQFIQQVIKILGAECLGFLKAFVLKMLPGCTLLEAGKVCRVAQQAVQKTRALGANTMAEILPALLAKVIELGGEVGEVDRVLGVVSESVKERSEAFKNCFALLHTISHTGCIQCLQLPPCLPCVPILLQMLINALRTSPELELVQKSFQIVSRITAAWCSANSEVESWVLTRYIPAALDALVTWTLDAKTLSLVGDLGQVFISLTLKIGDRGLYALYNVFVAAPYHVSPQLANTFLCALKDSCSLAGNLDTRIPPSSKVRGPLREVGLAMQSNRLPQTG
jgi:exportin-T